MNRKLFPLEFLIVGHIAFCIIIELQSVIFPHVPILNENEAPPKHPHANHNEYFDLYGFIGYALLLVLKWFTEGMRLNTLISMASYLFFFLDRVFQFTDKIFCQIAGILLIFYIWTLITNPCYELPTTRTAYRSIRVNDGYMAHTSVYYPCDVPNAPEQLVQWLPSQKYSDQIYDRVISRGWVPIYDWWFSVAFRFLNAMKFTACINVPLTKQEYPVVIFSHGLSQHRNSYTYLAQALASEGFIVFVPQHQEMVYPWDVKETKIKYKGTFPEILEKYQSIRAAHLLWRVEQIQCLIKNLKDQTLDFFPFKASSIHLIGHSFGGAAVLRSGQIEDVDSVIAIDPWMFPMQANLKEHIKAKCLILSKEKDLRYDEVFQFKTLQEFLDNNQQVEHYRVKGMDHVHSTDLSFFMSSEMALLGELRNVNSIWPVNSLISQAILNHIRGQPQTSKQLF